VVAEKVPGEARYVCAGDGKCEEGGVWECDCEAADGDILNVCIEGATSKGCSPLAEDMLPGCRIACW
jgi:hypothetical protein